MERGADQVVFFPVPFCETIFFCWFGRVRIRIFVIFVWVSKAYLIVAS